MSASQNAVVRSALMAAVALADDEIAVQLDCCSAGAGGDPQTLDGTDWVRYRHLLRLRRRFLHAAMHADKGIPL